MSSTGLAADEPAPLWDAWLRTRDHANREALVERYRPFARILAARCYSRRYSRELEFRDYEQYANVGLLEAIDRFDPTRGVQFEQYASQRITGAIFDGTESLSEVQRQISTRLAIHRERAKSLAEGLGTRTEAAGDALQRLADIAIGLAIGFMLEDAALYQGAESPDTAPTPYERVEIAQLRARLDRLVDELPDVERRVIRHHYYQHVPFEQIAAACGLTKGRISQIHLAALQRLRRLSAALPSVALATP